MILSVIKGENRIFPSQLQPEKPASVAGFSFLEPDGDQKRYQFVKHKHYHPARLSKGKKWYVSFQFRDEKGIMKKFRLYENINRIHDETEKLQYADKLIEAVNRLLKNGFNPFKISKSEKSEKSEKDEMKAWTLNESLNYFKQKLPSMGLRKRTTETYESILGKLQKKLSPVLHVPVSEIKKVHIAAALEDSGSNVTFNNNLTVIRRIFNFLIDQEITSDNPAKKVKPKPELITRHRSFDEKTWEKIKKKSEPDLLEFILFLYHTGTRPNEARQLRYEHIKGDKLLIPAAVSKNGKDSFVPLSESIIKKYKKGNGLIFGKSDNYWSGRFLKVKKSLKLQKDFTLYSIKATRAVHLAEDGASPYSIMQLFRHSSLEMTMKYLRGLGINIGREAAEKVREL